MVVSKEEILHIAKLADLNIKDEEIDEYAKNLQDILNFVDVLNIVNTENEIKEFGDRDILLKNAPEQEDNMFKIPKVI